MSINTLYTNIYSESIAEGSRRSAEEIVPLIMELINPASVIDVGCGLGTWLSVFKGHGVKEILGIDGDYINRNNLQIRPDEFLSFDLKCPLQMGRTFDLVVSLEVAEHLPGKCADTFIRTLTKLGDVILFSAAIPFQMGLGHLNGQWPVYWLRLFQKQGFPAVDCLRERLWDNQSVEPWYAQNIFIFVRRGRMEAYPRLARQFKNIDEFDLSKVHPRVKLQGFDRMSTFLQSTGETSEVTIEVTEPIVDVVPPEGAERVLCHVEIEGTPLGQIELPVCGEFIPDHILIDGIASNFAWPIIGRFFENTVYPELQFKKEETGLSVYRGALCLCNDLCAEESGSGTKLHDRVGWTVFLQELWGLPDWAQGRFYDPTAKEENADVCLVSGHVTTVEVATELNEIKVSGKWLDVEFMVGGVAVAFLTLPVKRKRVNAQQLRATVSREMGFELCQAAVREALIGAPLNGSLNLRERLARAAKMKEKIDEHPVALLLHGENLSPSWSRAVKRVLPQGNGGLVLGRHAGNASVSSVSRRALLPIASAADLVDAATTTGQPIIQVAGKGPQGIWYAPDLLWRSCQQPSIKPQTPTLRCVKDACSPLYRVQLFQRRRMGGLARMFSRGRRTEPETIEDVPSLPPGPDVGAQFRGVHRDNLLQGLTYRLPILMYHRVAPIGSKATVRYCVAPEVFEKHLRYLRDACFYSVTLEKWREAMEENKPLPGRAVLITFDGGYLDILNHAQPLLKRYGFSAIVFLVVDKIGQSNSRDQTYGEELPLLGWKEIRRLHDEGIEFGSHNGGYPFLTALSPAEVVREAVSSRAAIQRVLGQNIAAFSYSLVTNDLVISHLLGACGYVFGLSCRPGLCGLHEPLLALPRIEVSGSVRLKDFISKLKTGEKPQTGSSVKNERDTLRASSSYNT